MKEQKKIKYEVNEDGFPSDYPFWDRLKIDKNKTVLIIDRDLVRDKLNNKMVPGFIHREASSKYKKDREIISPNPDKAKKSPMYLKSPRKIPIHLVKKHNKNLDMPKHLKERYSKIKK